MPISADADTVAIISFIPNDAGMFANSNLVKQSTGLAGDDLVKALEGLGLEEGGEGGGDDGNVLPIMQSIMQNLLSKEVLYPSLKEITAKVCTCFTSNHLVLSSTVKFHL